MTQYTLVIDTDQYSGNFELELTGWVSGLGNTEGRRSAQRAIEAGRKELPEFVQDWFEEHTRADGEYNDCCGIEPTPGWFNNGNGKHYKDADHPAYKGSKCPAYQSVAIYLDAPPPPKVLAVVKDRATTFTSWPERAKEPLTIIGFRLKTEKITTTITYTDL